MAESTLQRVEKHQVTRLQLGFIDALGGCRLLLGAARQQQADALLVHRPHKTAAVEARFSGVAAALVRHAQKTHRIDHQLGSSAANRLAHLIDLAEQAPVCQKFVHLVCAGVAGGQRSQGNEDDRSDSRHGLQDT